MTHPFPTRASSDLRAQAAMAELGIFEHRARMIANRAALAAARDLGFDAFHQLLLTMELRENNGADSALRYPETDEAHLVDFGVAGIGAIEIRSEEHTSELQSLMRI